MDAARSNANEPKNVWREARLRAAKYNEALSSQDSVADLLGFGRDAIRRIENNLNKVMPVDTAVLLSDLYNEPSLLNHYCLHECPIGCRRAISDETVEIDRATVKLSKALRKEEVQRFKHELEDIAEDGIVSEDEFERLDEVIDDLREVAKIISELEIIRDRLKKE